MEAENIEVVFTQEELNAQEIKANGFLNPFSSGVTYEAFLEAVKELGKDMTVAKYLKGKISDADLDWIVNDLKNFKNN